MAYRKVLGLLVTGLVLAAGLVAWPAALRAQPEINRPVINKIEAHKTRAGSETTLTLRGKGFLQVKKFEAVRVGDLDVEVLGHSIESDEVAHVRIRVPSDAPGGTHEIAIRASGDGFSSWLAPQPASPPAPRTPQIQVLLEGQAGTGASDAVVEFDTTFVGSPVSRTFTIRNSGQATLKLNNLQLPAGFRMLGPFPDSIAAGSTASVTLQLAAEADGSYGGRMQFNSNVGTQNPFALQLRGSVTRPPAVAGNVVEPPSEEAPPRPSPSADMEVLLDGRPLADVAAGAIRFEPTSVDSPVSRVLKINNVGETTLRLSNLRLPAGFRLLGSFPDSISAGGSAVVSVQVAAAGEGSFSGTLQFNTNVSNQNPFAIQLVATVTPAAAPPPEPPDRQTRNIIILVLTAVPLLAGGAMVTKKLIRRKLLQVEAEIDLGSQKIPAGGAITSGFELRLRPSLDYGRPEVHVDGALVVQEKEGVATEAGATAVAVEEPA